MAEEVPTMFSHFFVCRRTSPQDRAYRAEVVESFPSTPAELLEVHPKVTAFCFPEGTVAATNKTARFTYTLTDKSGSWLYGFCVRATKRTADGAIDCLCILSKNPWFDLFYEVLGYAELQYALDKQPTVIHALYDVTPQPRPGERFSVTTTEHRFYVTRPLDDFPLVDAAVPDFLSAFGLSPALDLLCALFEERRVLFVGSDLDKVTGAIHALTALYYPFTWPFPFVPVLPPSMLDAICSPTPFIMGIHAEVLKQAASLPTESLVLADTRNGSITGLPEEARKLSFPHAKTRDRIKEAMERKGRSKNERTVDILSAVADFLAGVLGRARAYRVVERDRKGNPVHDVDDSAWVLSFASDRRLHRFATILSTSQAYSIWKSQAINDPGTAAKDPFTERCAARYPDLWDSTARHTPQQIKDSFNRDLGLSPPAVYQQRPPQPAAEAKAKTDGFFARFGRATNKVKKELFDKKQRDGRDPRRQPAQQQHQQQLEQCASSSICTSLGDDGARVPVSPRSCASPANASSPELKSIPAAPAANAALPTTSWLDSVGDLVVLDNLPKVAEHFPGDFLSFHASLNPFKVFNASEGRMSPYRDMNYDSPKEMIRPKCVENLTVIKVNGRVGCLYRGNEITEVIKGGGADNAGMVPGMRMLALNSEVMVNDSNIVKQMLDSAPQVFQLTVTMPSSPLAHFAIQSRPMLTSPAKLPGSSDNAFPQNPSPPSTTASAASDALPKTPDDSSIISLPTNDPGLVCTFDWNFTC
ncbi:DENN domain and WD repeat-containing protein SCD1 [Diplonema papillatum]|nr:DENN domain and WD repeat-containing protein SCD1 [Diplonema papillatum]